MSKGGASHRFVEMAQTFLDTISGGMSSMENQSAIQSILDAQTVHETTTSQVDDEDIFQCGKCKKQFTSLALFVSHKQDRCTPVPPRPVLHNTTLLQGLGASAFTAIGVQNGVRTQHIPQQSLAGFTTVSQATLPQISQNIVLPDEQILTFSDLAQPVQNSLVQGNTIHLAPATNTVQTNGPFLSQVTRLAPRPSNNVTILSAIQPTTSLSPSVDSAFTSTVIPSSIQSLIQPQQHITIATAIPDKPQNMHIVKPSPAKPVRKSAQVTVVGGELGMNQSSVGSQVITADGSHAVAVDEMKKKLVCTYCSKVFTKNFDLQQHIRSHTGEKPFQCVVCGRAFAQKSNVKKHMSTHKVWPTGAGNTLPAQPPPTLVPLPDNESETSAQESANQNSPDKQLQSNQNAEQTQAAGEVITIDKEQTDDKGDNKKGNKGNYKLKVVIDNSFICQYCPEKFKTYYQLKSHMVNHKNVQVYKCVVKDCSETFKTLETFLDHVQAHSEEMTYRCHQCNKEFITLYELGVHQYTHNMYDNTTKTGSYQCNLCMNKYSSKAALDNHMETASHQCPCPHCGKKFTCERFLRKHLLSHGTENLHKCPTCDKTFKTEHYLKSHVLIHTGDKPFACDLCGASFNRKDKLKRHNLIHDKRAKFKCPFSAICGCTKEFNRPDKLKSHLLTHSCVKPYSCDVCGRDFARRPHYNEHMRGHRGDYPYNCDKCKRGFFRPKLFREHKCSNITDQPTVTNRVFRPRRMKRKPGRPRKVVKKTFQDEGKEINIVNAGNFRGNTSVLVKVIQDNKEGASKGKNKKSDVKIEMKECDVPVNQEIDPEKQDGEAKELMSTETTDDNPCVRTVKETISNSSESIVYINSVPEATKVKKSKPECYVKTPPANLATPLSMMDRYITVQLTTTNNCDGSEIHAQLIPTGDLSGQFQFPATLQASHLDLPNTTLHPIQIIEGQPLTLTVSQGEQLGEVDVEQNVIDIPVDIVTVSNDQALVCSQEVTNAGDGEDAEQTYTGMEDYGAGDTVLQGSENLIDSSVEIMGPDTM